MLPTQSCLETICSAHGQLLHLDLHEVRLNATRAALWGARDTWSLSTLLKVPEEAMNGIFKCRLVYDQEVRAIEWEPYQIRPIRSLKRVYSTALDYSFKFQNRTAINNLFETRTPADDILIIKGGYLTDTSYCNVALHDGKEWLTPSSPLLNGTQRAWLIQQGLIREWPISEADLSRFHSIRLFNAMISWENAIELPVSSIM